MEVILAKTSGFCFGVRRAVDTVYEQTGRKDKIYTYGPIIHNEEVVKDLEDKGVKVLNSMEELETLDEGTIIIRSHGVPKSICERIAAKGLECIDATCPFVKRIHKGRQIGVVHDDCCFSSGNALRCKFQTVKISHFPPLLP